MLYMNVPYLLWIVLHSTSNKLYLHVHVVHVHCIIYNYLYSDPLDTLEQWTRQSFSAVPHKYV